jgi:hypothetical protein
MNTAWSAQTLLPVYAGEELAGLDLEGLLELLIRNEDRVPRALVDECARRGEAIVERFAALVERDEFWMPNAAVGEWWGRLHAVMILGLIASESAGLLLVRLMRRMAVEDDDNLQGWLAGDWPALFANKPSRAVDAARELAEDHALDWYVRGQGIEIVVDAALRAGAQALEASLDWVAVIASNESEDWTLRLSAANALLDFPRERYRALVEDLAARQSGWGVYFSKGDVRQAFDRSTDEPEWLHFSDPWRFYTPEAIARRQQRWAEEDAAERDDEALDAAPVRYVRAAPKVGRNDPCPCGSGKKYKKCCLGKGSR